MASHTEAFPTPEDESPEVNFLAVALGLGNVATGGNPNVPQLDIAGFNSHDQ